MNNSMTTKLKPCPFCGSEKTSVDVSESKYPGICVTCEECCAEGPAYSTDAMAIEQWNTRPQPIVTTDGLEWTVAEAMYVAHSKYHGFSGERWSDEPATSRLSWVNKARAAIEATGIQSLTEAKASLERALTWQPIETAPRDWLMLWTGGGWRLGFHKSDGTWHFDGEEPATPTHWMPLPEPPALSTTKTGDA